MYADLEERRSNWVGAGISVLLHAGVAAAFLVNIGFHKDPFMPKPDRSLSVFNVPMARMERQNAPIEKIATKPRKSEKVSEDPPPSVEETIDASTAGDIETNWTPPPPPSKQSVDLKVEVADKLALIKLPEPDPNRRNLTPEFISGSEESFAGDDVRQAASKLEGKGNVTLRFTVNVDGSVKDCEVSSSSGSPLLDAKACQLVSAFVYKPGTDDRGAPTPKSVLETIEWLSNDGVRRIDADGDAVPVAGPAAPAAASVGPEGSRG